MIACSGTSRRWRRGQRVDPQEKRIGYLIVVLGFLFLGWFGARLIGLGLQGIRKQTLETGFRSQLRGRPAMIVGGIILVAGLLVIAPFVWGITHLLGDVITRYLASAD